MSSDTAWSFAARPSHGLPRAPKELRDRGLVRSLGEPCHDVFEVSRVPGAGAGPRDLFGDDLLAAPAVEPSDLRPQVQLRRSEIEVTPPAGRAIVGGSCGEASGRAAELLPPPAKSDHDAGGCELDPGDGGPGQAQHLVECGADAHVSRLAGEGAVGWRTTEPTAGATRARLPLSFREVLHGRNALLTGTIQISRRGYFTHGNPRSPPFSASGPGWQRFE